MAIVDYKKEAQRRLNALLKDKEVSEKNKKDFQRYLNALDVSDARIGIICVNIRKIFHLTQDLVGVMNDRDSINKLFKTLKTKEFEHINAGKGKKYNLSLSTIETIKNVTKAYLRWHNKNKTPEGFMDVKSKSKAQKRDLKPEDMITGEDLTLLTSNIHSLQFKALISVMLDGGFRPSELVDINLNDIKKDGIYIVIRVNKGKTGKRDVILFRSVPDLNKWLNSHPGKEKDSPLWIQENNSYKEIVRYKYPAIRKRLIELKKKIGFQKPIDLYNFRHSACYLAKLDNTPSELAAKKFGHSVKFYTETYGRLGVEDDIKRFNKLHKIGQSNDEDEAKPIECFACKTINEGGLTHCESCQRPLNMKEALKGYNEIQNLKDQMAEMIAKLNDLDAIKRELNKRKSLP